MTDAEQQFRSSAFRTELAEFLATPCGRRLLEILSESLTPRPIDPNSAASAWIAAHEQNVGRQEIIQLTIDLSQPPPVSLSDERADFGLPEDQLPKDI